MADNCLRQVKTDKLIWDKRNKCKIYGKGVNCTEKSLDFTEKL